MSQNRKQAIRRAHAIENAIRQVLLHDWDPIRIASVPEAANEYDAYIGGVYRLLASNADTTVIATHLATIQTEQMGLPAEATELMAVARRLQAIDVSVGLLKTLNFGFFEDFKGSDTLLFSGNADELLSIANVLHMVAAGTVVGEINLDQSRGFQPRRSTVVSIKVVSDAKNEVAIERVGESVVANWWLSAADAAQAEDLVQTVIRSEGPRHEFIESDGDTQVIAAKDEYSSNLWSR